ncbi:MAG: DUF3987 domain-containing protein [Candidatus Nanopelagicales bacterium]
MSAQPMEPGQDWPELIPLDSSEPPPMPVEVLPPVVRDMAEMVADSAQVEATIPAVLGLGAVAALTQKTARVAATSQWSEPLSLFVLALADVSERKTTAYAHMVGPVHDLEAELEAGERDGRILRNERRVQLASQVTAARKAAAGGDGALEEAAQLAAQLEDMGPEERAPRIATDDTTTQKLKGLMADNGGRIALLSPEAAFLGTLKGAYSSNGDPADMSGLLSAYTGSEPIVVDRTGRTGERIARPALTVVMVGQPRIFEELSRIPGAQERGLIARFVVVRVPRYGFRALRTDERPAPADTAEGQAYARTLRALSQREVSDSPPVLRLSPEALALYARWHDALEAERAPEGGEWSVIVDFAQKAHGLALRFAGIFHLCEHHDAGEGDLIDLDTLRRACELTDWALAAHRAAVVGELTLEPVRHARALLAKAERGSLSKSRKADLGKAWAPFTERDVRIALGGRNKAVDSERAKIPLESVLEPYGYIRWSRELAAYEWHPDLAAGGER